MVCSILERAIISKMEKIMLLAETAPLNFHIPNLPPPLTKNPGCRPGIVRSLQRHVVYSATLIYDYIVM